MKGVFQKMAGIAGVLATVGIIVMAALSPRGEGFFPDLLSFGGKSTAESTQAVVSADMPQDAVADSLTMAVYDSLPAPAGDTLHAE